MKKPQAGRAQSIYPQEKEQRWSRHIPVGVSRVVEWSFTYAIYCSLLFIIHIVPYLTVTTAVLESPIASNPLT